jgi:macrolide transport system ATP-binding/permease protein
MRRLRRTPAFVLTAIAVLALGVGAATVIYAFVDATLVKPLPYREPARLVALFEHNPVGDRFHLSDFDYRAWKQRNHAFTSLDVYRPERDTLNKPEGPEEVSAALVSDGFFRTLGVTPALGRDFFAELRGMEEPIRRRCQGLGRDCEAGRRVVYDRRRIAA